MGEGIKILPYSKDEIQKGIDSLKDKCTFEDFTTIISMHFSDRYYPMEEIVDYLNKLSIIGITASKFGESVRRQIL